MPRTLIRLFLDTVERQRKGAQFLRRRAGAPPGDPHAWEALSADRAWSDVERFAMGLTALGVERGDRVALLSENRYEWAVSDLAIVGSGAVTVPIYPTLTAAQCRYILENSMAGVVIVSTAAQLEKIRAVTASLPSLRTVLVMDGPVHGGGLNERTWSDIAAIGGERLRGDAHAFRHRMATVAPDDLATIIYTSGTTGDPKGAMLTHANISSNVESCLKVVDLRPADTALSFLPLCHIFERMAGMYAMLAAGVTIAYAQSMDTVAADAIEVKPTILLAVPRFYEKVYARVFENAATQPPLRRAIFHWGVRAGSAVARARFARRTPGPWASFQARLADRLVGAKVRERVGGRLRVCISGGAPLGTKVLEFFYAVGIPILEGYGLTETSPVLCVTPLGRAKPGSVGPPVPGVEVRLGEEGEIQTRGPHVMRGYFHNEEATRIALRDGWFHTGDVGRFDEDGFLFITDRLKDLLVTAGGKKVAPQPLEGRLKTSKWISEAVMLGDRRPYCIALLVPNFVNLEHEATTRGWAADGRVALLARPEVNALYQSEIDRLNADLAPFEQIKKFALLDRDLTQESGELTPTLKVRRRIIAERFADRIEGLYAPGA